MMSHPNVQLGSAVKPLFSIGSENRSINYGSYGVAARAMNARRSEHVLRIEEDTDTFMRITGEGALCDVRRALASFIGVPDSEDLFLVDNAANAFNVLAESLMFNPLAQSTICGGDPKNARRLSVMMFDRQYPMCKTTCAFWKERLSAVRSPGEQQQVEVVEVALPHEVLDQGDDDVAAYVANAFVTGGHHVLIVDHVCWSPAVVLPVVDICRQVRAQVPGALIIVDGAHAVGNICLKNVFALHSREGLFDAYFSNCHKWLTSPRHAAFLYVAERWHQWLHPVVTSNFLRPPMETTLELCELKRLVQREFFWTGTRDLSNFLVIPDVIQFRQDVLGGEENIRSYCHSLAWDGAQRIAQLWCTDLVIRDRRRLCSMSNVFCPAGVTHREAAAVVDRMLREHHCYGAIMDLGDGRPFLRISAQVYNCLDDYEHFALLFLELLPKVRGAVPAES